MGEANQMTGLISSHNFSGIISCIVLLVAAWPLNSGVHAGPSRTLLAQTYHPYGDESVRETIELEHRCNILYFSEKTNTSKYDIVTLEYKDYDGKDIVKEYSGRNESFPLKNNPLDVRITDRKLKVIFTPSHGWDFIMFGFQLFQEECDREALIVFDDFIPTTYVGGVYPVPRIINTFSVFVLFFFGVITFALILDCRGRNDPLVEALGKSALKAFLREEEKAWQEKADKEAAKLLEERENFKNSSGKCCLLRVCSKKQVVPDLNNEQGSLEDLLSLQSENSSLVLNTELLLAGPSLRPKSRKEFHDDTIDAVGLAEKHYGRVEMVHEAAAAEDGDCTDYKVNQLKDKKDDDDDDSIKQEQENRAPSSSRVVRDTLMLSDVADERAETAAETSRLPASEANNADTASQIVGIVPLPSSSSSSSNCSSSSLFAAGAKAEKEGGVDSASTADKSTTSSSPVPSRVVPSGSSNNNNSSSSSTNLLMLALQEQDKSDDGNSTDRKIDEQTENDHNYRCTTDAEDTEEEEEEEEGVRVKSTVDHGNTDSVGKRLFSAVTGSSPTAVIESNMDQRNADRDSGRNPSAPPPRKRESREIPAAIESGSFDNEEEEKSPNGASSLSPPFFSSSPSSIVKQQQQQRSVSPSAKTFKPHSRHQTPDYVATHKPAPILPPSQMAQLLAGEQSLAQLKQQNKALPFEQTVQYQIKKVQEEIDGPKSLFSVLWNAASSKSKATTTNNNNNHHNNNNRSSIEDVEEGGQNGLHQFDDISEISNHEVLDAFAAYVEEMENEEEKVVPPKLPSIEIGDSQCKVICMYIAFFLKGLYFLMHKLAVLTMHGLVRLFEVIFKVTDDTYPPLFKAKLLAAVPYSGCRGDCYPLTWARSPRVNDWLFFLMNNNKFFSMFCALRAHPFSRTDRKWAYFFQQVTAFTFALILVNLRLPDYEYTVSGVRAVCTAETLKAVLNMFVIVPISLLANKLYFILLVCDFFEKMEVNNPIFKIVVMVIIYMGQKIAYILGIISIVLLYAGALYPLTDYTMVVQFATQVMLVGFLVETALQSLHFTPAYRQIVLFGKFPVFAIGRWNFERAKCKKLIENQEVEELSYNLIFPFSFVKVEYIQDVASGDKNNKEVILYEDGKIIRAQEKDFLENISDDDDVDDEDDDDTYSDGDDAWFGSKKEKSKKKNYTAVNGIDEEEEEEEEPWIQALVTYRVVKERLLIAARQDYSANRKRLALLKKLKLEKQARKLAKITRNYHNAYLDDEAYHVEMGEGKRTHISKSAAADDMYEKATRKLKTVADAVLKDYTMIKKHGGIKNGDEDFMKEWQEQADRDANMLMHEHEQKAETLLLEDLAAETTGDGAGGTVDVVDEAPALRSLPSSSPNALQAPLNTTTSSISRHYPQPRALVTALPGASTVSASAASSTTITTTTMPAVQQQQVVPVVSNNDHDEGKADLGTKKLRVGFSNLFSSIKDSIKDTMSSAGASIKQSVSLTFGKDATIEPVLELERPMVMVMDDSDNNDVTGFDAPDTSLDADALALQERRMESDDLLKTLEPPVEWSSAWGVKRERMPRSALPPEAKKMLGGSHAAATGGAAPTVTASTSGSGSGSSSSSSSMMMKPVLDSNSISKGRAAAAAQQQPPTHRSKTDKNDAGSSSGISSISGIKKIKPVSSSITSPQQSKVEGAEYKNQVSSSTVEPIQNQICRSDDMKTKRATEGTDNSQAVVAQNQHEYDVTDYISSDNDNNDTYNAIVNGQEDMKQLALAPPTNSNSWTQPRFTPNTTPRDQERVHKYDVIPDGDTQQAEYLDNLKVWAKTEGVRMCADDTHLVQMLKARNWNAVIRLLDGMTKDEQQAAARTKEGRAGALEGHLPLHLAALYGAVDVVVNRLIALYPEGLRVYDPEGHLPLHLAIIHHNNFHKKRLYGLTATDPIALMVNAYPRGVADTEKQGARSNCLQLALRHHCSVGIIRYMVKQYPEALFITDAAGKGNLPIHLAIKYSAHVDFISDYLKEDAHIMTIANSSGDLPLHIACRYHTPMDVFELCLKQPLQKRGLSVEGNGKDGVVVAEENIDTGSSSSSSCGGGGGPASVLPSIVESAEEIDGVDENADQVTSSSSSTAAAAPAAASTIADNSAPEEGKSVLDELDQSEYMKPPSLATVRNNKGELPLHILMATGAQPANDLRMQLLLEEFPESIYEPDPALGIEPINRIKSDMQFRTHRSSKRRQSKRGSVSSGISSRVSSKIMTSSERRKSRRGGDTDPAVEDILGIASPEQLGGATSKR